MRSACQRRFCDPRPPKMMHTVVHRLKVVHEGQDVLMPHRDPLQDRNLIPHHVFPAGHETLIDHLGCVVSTRVDVHAFLDDRVRACAKGLARLVSAGLYLRLCPRGGPSAAALRHFVQSRSAIFGPRLCSAARRRSRDEAMTGRALTCRSRGRSTY